MTTLAILTHELEKLCAEIEDVEDSSIPENLLERFADASLEHSKKVGSYVVALESLKNNATYYKERIKRLQKRVSVYENIETAIKLRLIDQIKSHPDLPWKSNEGDRLALQNNAERLDVKLPLDKRHVNNVLVDHSEIPVEFIVVNTFYTLNTQSVKAHLQTGATLSWASLERGQHLRIY